MRIFLDSNVWISAFGTKGLSRDLVRYALDLHVRGEATLLVSARVAEETTRILREKFRLGDEPVEAVLEVLALCESAAPDAPWRPDDDFPDPDDVPLLAAALAAGADLFVTGDKDLLDLGSIEGLPIVDPRTAYLRLRGLG